MMNDLGPRLSAYMDGALNATDLAEVDMLLAADPALRAELADLRAANDLAVQEFGQMLATPIPLLIARSLRQAPEAAPPVRRGMPVWATLAASLALVAFGAAGGYVAHPGAPPRDWVAEIAEYHALYATQVRHLAEVQASEADHIAVWLAENVGASVPIPDLTAQGLTFEGGRLLMAAGKPVGQLMYRDATGQVVALCFTASDLPPTAGVNARQVGNFDVLVWGVPGARIILIGPQGYAPLPQIAELARSV